MSEQDLKAQLERLKAENEALKNRSSKAVSMKVSEKGGVSVYGLGRFPVHCARTSPSIALTWIASPRNISSATGASQRKDFLYGAYQNRRYPSGHRRLQGRR